MQRVDEGFKSYFKLLKTKGIQNPDGPHYKKKNSHYNIKYLNNSFKLIDNKIRLMIPKGLLNHLIEKGFDIKDKFLYVKLNKVSITRRIFFFNVHLLSPISLDNLW